MASRDWHLNPIDLAPENLEIAGWRLGRVGLTYGNVGVSRTPGNHTAETRALMSRCHDAIIRDKFDNYLGDGDIKVSVPSEPEKSVAPALPEEPEATKQQEPPTATPWNSKWGNVAQISSAVISLLGFATIIVQLYLSREKTIQDAFQNSLSEARKVYMSYSESTLKYPELSTPNYDMLMHNHVEFLRYQNFVSHMLFAYDEILGVLDLSDDAEAKKEWGMSFEIDATAHRRYLCQITDSRFFEMYRPSMRARLPQPNGAECKGMAPLVEERTSPLQRLFQRLLPH